MECLCPLRIHTQKPNPQCDGIWKWGLREVIRQWRSSEARAHVNGISTLNKGTPESSCLWPVRTQQDSEPGSEPSLDTESAHALILDFPAYISFISTLSRIFYYISLNCKKQKKKDVVWFSLFDSTRICVLLGKGEEITLVSETPSSTVMPHILGGHSKPPSPFLCNTLWCWYFTT